tara:strand:- start:448 stop:705 length:258 start_codon:yes stop_codon:yes gene_type:complete
VDSGEKLENLKPEDFWQEHMASQSQKGICQRRAKLAHQRRKSVSAAPPTFLCLLYRLEICRSLVKLEFFSTIGGFCDTLLKSSKR